MDNAVKRRIAVLLITGAFALTLFFRSAGADSVRTVQALLLFAGGMCAGVALTLFRNARRS